jgi:cytochrome b involved in lipid metabolism
VDLIFGLPLHPLIIHAVVVLVPLSALGVIFLLVFPRFAPNFSPLILILLIASTIVGFIAETSGQALSDRVGYPGDHAEQGERLSKLILLFTLLYITWFVIYRKSIKFKSLDKLLKNSLSVLLLLAAITSTTLTFIVGHSGAKASWADRIKASSGMALTDFPAQDQVLADQNLTVGVIKLTNSEVKKHYSRDDCWSIVYGKVYNLTSFVQQHPGGIELISSVCGIDGTAAFSNQHGSSTQPNNVLARLLLGSLGEEIAK